MCVVCVYMSVYMSVCIVSVCVVCVVCVCMFDCVCCACVYECVYESVCLVCVLCISVRVCCGAGEQRRQDGVQTICEGPGFWGFSYRKE